MKPYLLDNQLTVFFPGAVGDAVLSLPAFQQWPGNVVGVGLSDRSEAVLEFLADRSAIRAWVPWREVKFNRIKQPLREEIPELEELLNHSQRVVVLEPDRDEGWSEQLSRWYRGRPIPNVWLDDKAGKHASYALADECGQAGLPIVSDEALPPTVQHGGDFRQDVLLCPGAGTYKRAWPIEYFHGLERLFAKKGLKVRWLLGKDEDRDVRYEEFKEPQVSRGGSITDAATVMAGSGLFVGHNSGLTQVAASIGVRTLCLSRWSWQQKWWDPPGDHVTGVYYEHQPGREEDGTPLRDLRDVAETLSRQL